MVMLLVRLSHLGCHEMPKIRELGRYFKWPQRGLWEASGDFCLFYCVCFTVFVCVFYFCGVLLPTLR